MKGRSCSLNAAADFNKVFFLNHISFFLLATPFDLPLIMSSCCQDWKKHWKSSPGSNASIKNAKKNLFDVRYHFDLATRILELVAKRYTLYRLKATDQKFCTSRCPFPLLYCVYQEHLAIKLNFSPIGILLMTHNFICVTAGFFDKFCRNKDFFKYRLLLCLVLCKLRT